MQFWRATWPIPTPLYRRWNNTKLALDEGRRWRPRIEVFLGAERTRSRGVGSQEGSVAGPRALVEEASRETKAALVPAGITLASRLRSHHQHTEAFVLDAASYV